MNEKITEITQMIIELLEQKKYSQIRSILENLMPADLALLFEELEKKELVITFRLLPKELAAEALAYIEPYKQRLLLDAISDKEIRDVFELLYLFNSCCIWC